MAGLFVHSLLIIELLFVWNLFLGGNSINAWGYNYHSFHENGQISWNFLHNASHHKWGKTMMVLTSICKVSYLP